MRIIVLTVIMFVLRAELAHADVAMITECSQPQGMAIEFAPKVDNWHEEKLEQTKVSFIRVGSREYDIVIKDQHGDILIKSHDPHVVKVFENNKGLTIISTPPIGLVEVFQLSTLHDGKRIAIWNIIKNNTLPLKNINAKTYILQCEDR